VRVHLHTVYASWGRPSKASFGHPIEEQIAKDLARFDGIALVPSVLDEIRGMLVRRYDYKFVVERDVQFPGRVLVFYDGLIPGVELDELYLRRRNKLLLTDDLDVYDHLYNLYQNGVVGPESVMGTLGVSLPDEDRTCPRCNGTGNIGFISTVRCPDCGGTGVFGNH